MRDDEPRESKPITRWVVGFYAVAFGLSAAAIWIRVQELPAELEMGFTRAVLLPLEIWQGWLHAAVNLTFAVRTTWPTALASLAGIAAWTMWCLMAISTR